MVRRIRYGLFLIILGSLLIACGGGGGGGGSIAAQAQPQDVLNGIVQASAKNDNSAIMSFLTTRAQSRYKNDLTDPLKVAELGESLSKAIFLKITPRAAIYDSSLTTL